MHRRIRQSSITGSSFSVSSDMSSMALLEKYSPRYEGHMRRTDNTSLVQLAHIYIVDILSVGAPSFISSNMYPEKKYSCALCSQFDTLRPSIQGC